MWATVQTQSMSVSSLPCWYCVILYLLYYCPPPQPISTPSLALVPNVCFFSPLSSTTKQVSSNHLINTGLPSESLAIFYHWSQMNWSANRQLVLSCKQVCLFLVQVKSKAPKYVPNPAFLRYSQCSIKTIFYLLSIQYRTYSDLFMFCTSDKSYIYYSGASAAIGPQHYFCHFLRNKTAERTLSL